MGSFTEGDKALCVKTGLFNNIGKPCFTLFMPTGGLYLGGGKLPIYISDKRKKCPFTLVGNGKKKY